MNKIIIFVLTLLVVSSCADENAKPIITFDDAGKGAYVKLIEKGNQLINLFDIDGSVFVYSVEFVDLEKGNLISEYNLDLTLRDNTPDNGVNVQNGPLRLRSFSASEFETTERGFKGLSNITFTASELIAAAGATADQLGPGDVFIVNGSLVMNDGRVFAGGNSSAAVRGSAFAGFFDFALTASCPSNLEGSYAYETTDIWCGGTSTGSVDIIALGGGSYRISDWSFGSYAVCYGGGVADSGGLTFKDVCNEVSYTGFVDVFGDTWTWTSSVDGDRWTMTWENTYGEAATSTIINNGGDWPFTLK